MENREAIEILSRPFSMQEAPKEILDAHRLAISALEKQEQDRWHVVAKEGNPKENGEYLVTRGFIPYLDIVKKVGDPPIASDIVAWRPLPKPYMEENNDTDIHN